MATLINIYEGILKYKNSTIVIVIDDQNEIWFYAKHITNILEYKSPREIIKKHVDPINKTTYGTIKEFSKFHYNVQDHAVFINQAGLYELILRSQKKEAIKFKRWITYEVIPSLKDKGSYNVENEHKAKLEKINEQLNTYKKRVKVLENNQKKAKYPEGGYVYAVRAPDSKNKNLFKTGKTDNMDNRMNTYNTTLPDNMIVAHKIKVDDPIAVEYCIKASLNHLRYRGNKEYFAISKPKLIKIMENCKKYVNKTRKIKRNGVNNIFNDDIDNMIEKSDTESTDNESMTDEEYFVIFGVPLADSSKNNEQTGGSDMGQLYQHNKMMYLLLKNAYPSNKNSSIV